MPFGERFNKFKPKLSDRIRGKTADEILEEINKNFNNNRDSNMDFDNTDSNSKRSVRSHLEDLAKRHPDIANHLRCPPWEGEPSSKRCSKKKPVSEEENNSKESSDLNLSNSNSTDFNSCQQSSEDKMNQHQNTDNNSENLDSNDEKPQRFVSKLEFTPVNTANNQTESTESNQQQQPQQPQPQQQQKQKDSTPPQGDQKKPNVRHIPIFVEGRSEPVYPKNIDKVFNNSMGSNKSKPTSGRQSPFKNHHSFYDQNNIRHQQTPSPPPQHQQAASQDSRSTPPPPQPPTRQQKPLDALDKVQIVQKEVEELAKAVDVFSGNSRSDKQYIYLDEMLTRNLIKLDTIETEGRDDVRVARKKAIKTIQDTIAVLEDKVPQLKTEPMVIDESNENSVKSNELETATADINSETNTEGVKN